MPKDEVTKVEQNIHDYHSALRRFVDRVGDWAWIYKLEKNCEEGIYPAQKVRYDYFGTEAIMQQEKDSRRRDVYASAKKYNLTAERVGEKKMSERDVKIFANFLLDARNRDYFRQRSKKEEEKLKTVSLLDLYNRRKELNKKREEKRARRA